MTCISVTERVRRNPFRDSRARCGLFDGALDMGFMEVIAPLFPEFHNEGQSGCREEPLPDKLSGGVLVFLFRLTNQMRRAAVSISSNLAEGCSRSSKTDYARFVEIATGSVFEVVSQATIGRNQGFLNPTDYERLYAAAEKQSRILSGLRKSLETP